MGSLTNMLLFSPSFYLIPRLSMVSSSQWTRSRPPKKPSGPFLIFLQERRTNQVSPDTEDRPDVVSFAKQAAQEWKELDQARKDVFNQKFKQAKAAYEVAKSEWESQKALHLPDEVDLLEERLVRVLRERSRIQRDLERPKRYATPFLLYVKHVYNTESSEKMDRASVQRRMAEIAEKWRNLGEHEKEPFVRESLGLKAEYEQKQREYSARAEKDEQLRLVNLKINQLRLAIKRARAKEE